MIEPTSNFEVPISWTSKEPLDTPVVLTPSMLSILNAPEVTLFIGVPTVTFEGPTGNIAKPFWDFKPRGQSGKMTSELLPHLGSLVDEFCFIKPLIIFSISF